MTCFGFVNGANRPWRSVTVYDDGDFVEVQVLSSEEPSASTELRHYQEDDEDFFDRAVEPSTNCASSSHVAFLDPIESVVFRPRDEVPGLAPYWSFSAHPDDGQEQFAIALRHCWPDLDDSTRWSLLIPHDTWRTSLALTAWRAAYIIDHTVDRKPGHALILVEFRRADRPPTAAHVSAEWVLALISPGLLTQFLDREGECAQPGRHCQFSLNNRPYFGYDSIPFAHGDYVLIEVVETDAQMIVVYKPQSKHGSTIWRRYWDFGLIICLDFLAFILTFAVLSYVRKPRSHKLCKVGLTRHAVQGRRPKTKACWRIACFVYLLTSAEALPLSQRASQVVDHDLDHTAATDFGFPSSRLIGCKHDGEAPTASVLIPVSIPEFAFQGQQLRQPRMTFVGDVDLQNAVTRLSDIAPGPFVLETFGLYDESVGTRTITVHTLTLQHIRSTVHAAWIDYTGRFDSRILHVQPQPTYAPPPIKLFLIVQFIDFGLHLPATLQPVLVEQQVVSASGATDTTVRVAEYVDAPTNIEAVFTAARLTHSCLPRGIRPCAVHWRDREWTYPSILRPLAGDYMVVRVDNLEQYFRGTVGFFPGARRFALEGQRVFAQLHSGNMLPLWIHAIAHNYEPLGWRQTTLPKQDLLQPERVWNYAQHLWRDKAPGRGARLLPASPQPSVRNQGRIRLHLIFAFRVRLNYQPTLYVGMLHFDAAYHSYAQELQWNAVYTPAVCDTDGLLRASTFGSFVDIVRSETEIVYGGEILDGIAELAVLPGAFFVVNLYVTTWLNVVTNLWQHVQQLPHHSTQRPTSLLQTSVHLRKVTLTRVSPEQFFLHPFSNLPPPGNGTLVDLRRNLDSLDDITFHDWGECCFDANTVGDAPITSVHVQMPNLRALTDYLCGARLPSMPSSYIYDHTPDLPPECLDWVDQLSAQPPDQPVCRQVYTDGSYDAHSDPPVRVGWGFAVFLCGPDCIYLEHLACGYIEDDLCPMAHGLPVKLNARTGEIEALIQASLWLLAAGSAVPVETYYDAITVGHSGYGQWNFNPTDRHMRVLRSLAQLLATLPHPPSGHHVKAHEGIFGNEVANLLAQRARIVPETFGAVDNDLSQSTQGERMPLEHVWLDCVRRQDDVDAWPLVSDDTLHCWKPSTTPTVASSLPKSLWDDAGSTTKLRTLEIGFATYNVGTLMEARDRSERLQAQEYLRSQATAHGLDVIFLRETRAKKDAVVESASHVRLIAASNNGHGGTEIWIAKRKQNGRATGATVRDMIVLHCEAELLVVRWRTSQGIFTLVSGHAPHSGRSKIDIHNWWISLTSIISKFHEDQVDELVIGIDANAHFAEDMEPWIGHHGLTETTNLPGQLFSDLLVKFDLFLPSTFEQFHSGHTATWRVGTNKESRCDYVCFPLVWKKALLQSQPLPNLDAGMSSVDHVALGVWCRFVATTKHRPKASIDRAKIQQAFHLHADELLQSLRNISWSVDAHTHANLMSTTVSQWLTKHCPADKQGPRASYITQDTWSLRTTRLRLQRTIRNVGIMLAQHQSRMALHAWRHGLLLAQVRVMRCYTVPLCVCERIVLF